MAIARHKTRQRELREARALLRRVQRGDTRAFELFYATYEGRIYRFCHRLTGRAETASALVELTFARALANLPEGKLDALDVAAYLHATARTLAFERGGAPVGSRGEGESEVGAANERLPPQERALLALHDLERRPDAEIAAALGVAESDLSGLVGAARLHLLAELRPPGDVDACPGRLAALSAYADGAPPAEGRAELEAHLAHCADCRAALFALREAALRYREMPTPEPPGDLGSRITAALGAAGLPARSGGAEPDATGGRQTLAAVAMAALAIAGIGVTIAASRDDHGDGKPSPAPVPASAQPQALPSSPASGSPLASGATVVVATTRPAPPTIHHLRAGPRRHARPPSRQTRPSMAETLGLGKSYAPEFPPAAPGPPPPPAAATPPATPVTTPKPKRTIPVEIVPPVAPSHAQAASDAQPPQAGPEPPGPPPPPQTTTT
jgi:DNA-directed RNA polymerase specialized sigma24 family protein